MRLGERAEVDDFVVGPDDDDHAFCGIDQVAEGGFAAFLRKGKLAALGDSPQAGAEKLEIQRLQDVIACSLAQRGDCSLEVGVAGDDDHGGIRGRGLEAGHELVGSCIGESAVQDDRGEASPVVAGQRLFGAASRGDAMVVELEDVAEIVAHVRVVLDHQDVDWRRAVHERHCGFAPALSWRACASCPRVASRFGTSNGL